MVCGQDIYDEPPEVALRRENERRKRNLAAAEKILKFFQGQHGVHAVLDPKFNTAPSKVEIVPISFVVSHRGHQIHVWAPEPAAVHDAFTVWRKDHMPHMKVLRKRK